MKSFLTSIILLIFCLTPILCLSAPANSHVVGDSWYCNDGYKQVGNKCVKVIAPENAHVSGHDWYCNDGYKQVGDKCVKVIAPENAHVSGHDWYCNDGYKQVGDKCVKVIAPENAHVSGHDWYCNDGYKQVGNKCVKLSASEVEKQQQHPAQGSSISSHIIAYQTKIESDSGDVVKLENGAIVEISRYFGYIGYRKNAVLYGRANRCNIWIEGKKSYKCDLLKSPQSRGRPAEEVHISEVKGDGAIIIMLDGRIYEVDSYDTIETSLWLGISDGILIDNTTLINFDEREAVSVNQIR